MHRLAGVEDPSERARSLRRSKKRDIDAPGRVHPVATRVGDDGLRGHPRSPLSQTRSTARGRQERDAIAPAVVAAVQEGIRAVGPIAPDTVFRHCIEGRYDVVLAMFHDQGHVAVKTWGFVGNCALFLGAPYLFLSVGHGTAYDIVGRGVANHEMILSAMLPAASLAAGRGFLA